jgi:uncharacterized protein (TIGR00369 family)
MTMSTELSPVIPDGFTLLPEVTGYIGHNGPYYVKALDDGTYRYGFPTDDRHGNPNNVLHGAAMTGFIDTAFGHSLVYTLGQMCATVTLNAEFVSGVPAGTWIEARVEIKHHTKSIAYLQGDVYAGDQLLLSASGIWRIFDTPMKR